MKETPNILKARLDQIIIKRSESDPQKIGSICFHGKYFDEDGQEYFTNSAPFTETKWDDLPEIWRNALLPVLKNMSRVFNKIHVNEDVETF